MKIVDTDAFLDMPLSTQALYFHLAMRADDDGFVSNPKKIIRMLGVQDDELKVLFSKKFILGFENGVIVIKHWKIHNYIQNDRYTPTTYVEELAKLSIKENGGYKMDTDCIQIGDTGKVREGKDRLVKVSVSRFTPPTLEEVINYCKERNNSVDPQRFINFYESKGWMVGKNKMKDWRASVRTWELDKKDTKPKDVSERRIL